MKYKITHTTVYTYSDLVPVCQNEAHLTPRPSLWQMCNYHRLRIKPPPPHIGKRLDYFGNPVNFFTITEGHRKLIVTAISKLEVKAGPNLPSISPPWESVRDNLLNDLSEGGLDARQFTFDSPLVAASPDLHEFGQPSFTPGRPILEAVRDLTARVFTEFKYDPTATNVNTPLEEVLRLRRGVCQDLAHLAIGVVRSHGLAARYVSGYLRTIPPPGKQRLIGADASHAWLSVYCGSLGWVDVDPTNNVLIGTDHITLAWGRDYTDVCPIRGMFVGGGHHTMAVSVDVAPLEG
jgi:transglutaminase-like putative cysteine protease